MLNAKDALRITEKSLVSDSEIIKPYLKHIDGKIRKAAERGRRTIHHPFDRTYKTILW